jgi:xanthine dehydrogenase YagS FAD-binding subunit
VRDSRVVDARVAVGGVATVPWRLHGVEAALRGAPVSEAAFEHAAAVAAEGATPLSGNAFKLPLLRRTVVRALLELTAPLEMAEGSRA